MQQIMGHTEDALHEVLNHFYIVSAHIVNDKAEGKYNVSNYVIPSSASIEAFAHLFPKKLFKILFSSLNVR